MGEKDDQRCPLCPDLIDHFRNDLHEGQAFRLENGIDIRKWSSNSDHPHFYSTRLADGIRRHARRSRTVIPQQVGAEDRASKTIRHFFHRLRSIADGVGIPQCRLIASSTAQDGIHRRAEGKRAFQQYRIFAIAGVKIKTRSAGVIYFPADFSHQSANARHLLLPAVQVIGVQQCKFGHFIL
jgi:hypothetical protein